MTEPTAPRPVPGPPRPGPAAPQGVEPGESDRRAERPSFDELEHRPVAEHVAVFEAEHARLQRELGTIDSL
jgi:hypothetical protein